MSAPTNGQMPQIEIAPDPQLIAPDPIPTPSVTTPTPVAIPEGSPAESLANVSPIAPPPPSAPNPTTDLNAAILAAAIKWQGRSTADGPDGGNNACAWTVNRVLHEANIPPLGSNPNLVSSLVEALQAGRGQKLSPQEAKAGDLVIAYEEKHIGISLDDGCQNVLSNSSSRSTFSWKSNVNYDDQYYGSSTVYRLLR